MYTSMLQEWNKIYLFYIKYKCDYRIQAGALRFEKYIFSRKYLKNSCSRGEMKQF